MIEDKNKKRPYSVEVYNPDWELKFNDIRKVLSEIFGSKALDIEHVGSTSLGIKAKPVIDVLVIVENVDDIKEEKNKLISLGYKYYDNYIAPQTVTFFKEEIDGRKTENIHVCLNGSPKAIQFIDTRDYLKVHPERARAYGELKEELKKQYPNDYPAYRSGKQAFLDETERLTKIWKML